MHLPRPYIPIPVRIQVAMRQGLNAGLHKVLLSVDPRKPLVRRTLNQMLDFLFGVAAFELDHDPPLSQRKFNPRTGKYTPDANDPFFLVYRLKGDHFRKTFQRGDGAKRSDTSQRRYLKHIEAKRKPKRKFKPRPAKHIRRSNASFTAGHGHETK